MEDIIASFTLDTSQLTAQLRSIYSGSYKHLRYFVEHGYDVNAQSGRLKMSPLMIACFLKHLKKRIIIVDYLLEHGADPSFSDMHGRNSLFYACGMERIDVVTRLLRYADFDLNAVDAEGNTALHVCAAVGNQKIFKAVLDAVLKYSLNAWTKNKYYCSPWDIAYSKQHLGCIQLLFDIGSCSYSATTALVNQPSTSSGVVSGTSLFPSSVHLPLLGTQEPKKTSKTNADLADLNANSNAMNSLTELTKVQRSSLYCSPSKQTTVIDDVWVKSIIGYKIIDSSPIELDKLGLLRRTPSCDKTKVHVPRLLLKRAITSPRLPIM